ncbi:MULTISPECIES: manganese-binding transcriptional regulator MntR [Aureimonas]|uniref:Transcriptional regulator MntR n=2 Tax=Aureimonas TaxID=414371 RepID=A0A1H0HDE6_9HYPH|nr:MULTISPECIES: manganese-binding transcriptional regulator MntR [Aureimonas]MBB3934656.1 DtxR family manganese transport transcriptional regulator [Aureimonas phyllosphaerae]MBB3950533.1 DtxR family manganese transport transcriptional regulator [Aureimonas jatrophae]MBB3958128.1 DtxR family manganese transport transcriptional regulator [Aureimonas phyllosphaerae]SDO17103.1 iron (metal) dependent repressor, DtxR family [Aureimonas jatrophae]SFE92258.1 iron (metal) dependent repressor, DtxR fa
MTGGIDGTDAATTAARFARVRKANQSELSEDYVEMIDDLIAERGEARAADLAERFGVSPGTVARTVQRLARDGLVSSEPYRAIFLTAEGKELAERVRARHRLVVDFLKAIGVAPASAEMDAEGIEHHVGKDTLDAFRRFLTR